MGRPSCDPIRENMQCLARVSAVGFGATRVPARCQGSHAVSRRPRGRLPGADGLSGRRNRQHQPSLLRHYHRRRGSCDRQHGPRVFLCSLLFKSDPRDLPATEIWRQASELIHQTRVVCVLASTSGTVLGSQAQRAGTRGP